jgi:hypothetical protein
MTATHDTAARGRPGPATPDPAVEPRGDRRGGGAAGVPFRPGVTPRGGAGSGVAARGGGAGRCPDDP